jgi:hypothetical protein
MRVACLLVCLTTSHLRPADAAAETANTLGAMGWHVVNMSLLREGEIDAEYPEALLYQSTQSGEARLRGVEYIVFADAWHANHADPPVLEGQLSTSFRAATASALPTRCALHVWPGGKSARHVRQLESAGFLQRALILRRPTRRPICVTGPASNAIASPPRASEPHRHRLNRPIQHRHANGLAGCLRRSFRAVHRLLRWFVARRRSGSDEGL